MFPHEAIPDGTVWIFHHFTYPLLFAYVILNWVRDNHPYREPKYVDVGICVALISFLLAWPHYPVFGALGALAGLLIASYGLVFHDVWELYDRRWRALVTLCVLMAYDDWISHALGLWTPLDWIFNQFIFPLLG